MDVFQEVMAVGLVLAMLAGALWTLRRRGFAQFSAPRIKKGSPRRMASVERMALSPQHTLHLVRIGDRALLIAAHPAGCTLIESSAWRDVERAVEALR